MRNVIGKLALAFILAIYALATSSGSHYLILACVPVICVFRNHIVLELLKLSGSRLVLSGRIYIRENYVYFPESRRVLKLYRCDSLVSTSQLTSTKFVNISRDIVNRLTSVVEKLVILRRGEFLFIGFINILSQDLKMVKSKFEDILREYFDVREVDKTLLTSMFSCDILHVRHVLVPILISMTAFLACGLPGLVTMIAHATSMLLALRRLRTLTGWVGCLNNCLTSNEQLFKKMDDSATRSLSLCLSRGELSYIIVVQRCPELSSHATSRIGRAQEQLVVKERGKGYAEVMRWKTVIDRISEGEEPLLITMYADDQTVTSLQGFFTFQRTVFVDLVKPLQSSYALTDDIVPLIPLQGRAATDKRAHSRISLGVDRSGKLVSVSLTELPSRHIMIVGPTGMGKTRTAAALLRQLVQQGVRIIVFDPHGEYGKLLRSRVKIVDVRYQIPNIFELGSLTVSEKVHRLVLALEDSFGVKLSDSTYEALLLAYRRGLYRRPLEMLRELQSQVVLPEERLLFKRIEETLKEAKFIDPEIVLRNNAVLLLNFRNILHSPDILSFLMMSMFDVLYTWLSRIGRDGYLKYMLVLDEAYYVLGSRLLELTVRGFRKLGVGTMLITQSVSDISHTIVENIGLAILLGGPDSYVMNLAHVFNLSQEDIDWLVSALPPRDTGRTRALLVMGPTRYHVYINIAQ